MRAGRLRHRITIQRSTPGRGDAGERLDVWIDIATVWAAIRTISDEERSDKLSVDITATHVITIRHQHVLDDISPRDRIVHEGKTYHIIDVVNVGERDRQIDIRCVRRYRDE